LPILNFHLFDASKSIVSTPPGLFVAMMEKLVEAGFRCVDLGDWIRAGRPAVERGFALTFDDGDASILEIVDILPKLKLTATVFLVTDHVGGWNDWLGQPHWVPRSRLMDWSELAEAGKRGLRYGSHTKSHPDLTKISRREIEAELSGARDAMNERLGTEAPLLAYPYGRQTPRIRELAGRVHTSAVGTTQALAHEDSDPLDLPRIDAYYLCHSNLLDPLIEGRAERWLRWRNRLRQTRSILPWRRVGR
jgi:peptidoglycan/xylan/chitin deacetylase (PgdA/CDA1 family)